MKKLYLIILIVGVLFSCKKDDDLLIYVEQDTEIGYIEMTASWAYSSLINKGPVPECVPLIPDTIQYTLQHENGNLLVLSSPIIVVEFTVKATEVFTLPIGKYKIIDVSLYSNDIITHAVPEDADPLAIFVNQPLPIDVEITPDSLYKSQIQVACLVSPVDITIPFDLSVEILRFETFYFYIPPGSCVDQVSIQVDDYIQRFIPIIGSRVYTVYIPDVPNYWRANSYINGILFQSFDGVDYNSNNQIDITDIIQFKLLCR